MDIIKNRIEAILGSLEGLRYTDRKAVKDIWISLGDYKFCQEFQKENYTWAHFKRDTTWGGSDRHFWFLANVNLQTCQEEEELRIILNTGATDIWNTDNPQILVYKNGVLAGTMDMNHQELILSDEQIVEKQVELGFYAYSNSSSESNFFYLDTAIYRKDVANLYFDLKVAFEAADLLYEDDLERIETMKILNQCVNLLDLRREGSLEFYKSIEIADEYLQKQYYAKRCPSPITVHSIGHTHIDVAWKWPLKQTRQKVVRSFQTVLNLMDRYPEYKFMSSQPQLYQFLKEEAPEVYEKVRGKIQEGRWEAEGAMWLEPDCNLASGESLVRQILYGREFFEKELGAEANEVLWLPDVFGYSAALPQIMKKSGLSYFMTTKLGWNEYNQFPNDTFIWRGIDGSEVLTYLISTRDYQKKGDKKLKAPYSTTYNGRQNATQIMGTWQRYQNKDVSSDVLTCYGYGDGGGGPTEEMLEQSRRLEKSPGRCPKTRQTFVKDFFHTLEKNMDNRRLSIWSGELYLEYHRGTYTSMAKNKKNNRFCEFLNSDVEFFYVLAMDMGSKVVYPKGELEKNWKLLLLNQFHDILPGSSIAKVYKDSDKQYETIIKLDTCMIDRAQEAVLTMLDTRMDEEKPDAIAVWNQLSFSRTGIVTLPFEKDENKQFTLDMMMSQITWDGQVIYLIEDVLPKGVQIVKMGIQKEKLQPVFQEVIFNINGKPEQIQTSRYNITFDSNGEISSLIDREEQRDLLKKGQTGNKLFVYEDRPLEFDAWNIDAAYGEHFWYFDDLQEMKILEDGPIRGCVYVKRRFLNSVLEQYIYFYNHTGRIDFKTRVDWREHQLLLKTAFPMDILCNEANYEIQFGNVKRPTHMNTTWEQAQFEVCAHKWADISEAGYGVALLNDSKYGYDIHDSVMCLTLIKSGIFPNANADQGVHEFTYALFPHQGDFRQGRVIQEAYDLNCSLYSCPVKAENALSYSMFQIEEEHVFADTVKQSEDETGIIIRLYEGYGKRGRIHLKLANKTAVAMECDCMEQEICRMENNQGQIEFEIKPYEIKTIKLF